MLRVEWEPISRLLDDGLEDKLYRHWREASIDHDDVPLDPDWSRMLSLEREGYFKAAALRRDGALIGYSAFSVHPHLHFRSTLHATNSVVFVEPRFRGYAGGRLLIETERMLALLGVRKIIYGSPVGGGKKLGAVLLRLGYAHTEDFFCKLVGSDDGWQRRTDAVSTGEPGRG